MMRKSFVIVTLSLLAIAFLASVAFGEKTALNDMEKEANRLKNVKFPFAGAERPIGYYSPDGGQSLGADRVVSNSPGKEVGLSTYDLQSNTRNQRQVEWRGGYFVHFDWMKQQDSVPGGDRGTGYEVWDTDAGDFVFKGAGGGCDIHPRLGSGANYSGYVGLDVDTESKVVIHNHHEEGAGYASTIWYDFTPAACFFSPYKRRVPDSLMWYCVPDGELGEYEMIWPMAEYQVYDGDTVTHVFSQQYESDIDPSLIVYFRRVGSDTLGQWDYPPMCVDTVPTISQCVTASRTSAKAALVWQAPPGAYPGDPESWERDWIDEGLGVNQRINDIYYMTSDNMGASWSSKINLTAYDSTQGGYLGHGDMSILFGPDDNLHVLWPARVIVGEGHPDYTGGLGEYTNFYGARMLHWDETSGLIRTVKEANWDLASEDTLDDGTPINTLTCTGGAWNEMSLVKPMLSYCDGKFYAFFTQFLDLYADPPIYDDCAETRFTEGDWSGTANGEIYVSVSENDGANWDVARNLTKTSTPHCEKDGAGGLTVCESDIYVSVAKYGMYIDPGDDPDFFDAVVVVPDGGTDDGDFYLDVQYVNDKHPGSVMQNAGEWSYNPIKWFRVPCVEPVPNPVLTYLPHEFDLPYWTKPGQNLAMTVTMENIGNAPLTVYDVSITDNDPGGSASLTGWIGGTLPADGSTPTFDININHGSPAIVTGTVDIHSDHLNTDNHQYVTFEIIVADTVQFPEWVDIRTSSVAKVEPGYIQMTFNNAGNIGHGGIGDYNLDYSEDCDTTGNGPNMDDRATVYLFEASPFVCRIVGNDTIMYHYMFDNNKWLDQDGFKPLYSPETNTGLADYQYGYSDTFVTPDTLIALDVKYYMPFNQGDTNNFVVAVQRIWNLSGGAINNIFIGDAMDWDIPSDSGSNNQSDYDSGRKFMWQHGWEYGPDSIENDDCEGTLLANQRYGGFSYYGGYRLTNGQAGQASNDSIADPKAIWTENNADWVYPNGDFVGSQIWEKCVNTDGYETWEATGDFSNPDSMATDLHIVCVFGQFNLGANDEFTFAKILASEYDGGENAIKATIDKARAWIGNHQEIFDWPEFSQNCCDMPGDADNNNLVNILDITKLIGYLYQQQSAPPCLYEGDADGNCLINILDITKLIGFLYQQQSAPVCAGTCPGW